MEPALHAKLLTALAGIEPATSSLTVNYSTSELQSNDVQMFANWIVGNCSGWDRTSDLLINSELFYR